MKEGRRSRVKKKVEVEGRRREQRRRKGTKEDVM